MKRLLLLFLLFIVGITLLGQESKAIGTTGLFAYYDLENDCVDPVNSDDLTESGDSVAYDTGILGQGILLGGSADICVLNGPTTGGPTDGSDMSLSATWWMRADSAPSAGQMPIISYGDDASSQYVFAPVFQENGGYKLAAQDTGGWCVLIDPLDPDDINGTLSFWAIVVDSDYYHIYQNAVLINTVQCAHNGLTNEDLVIGTYSHSQAGTSFNGLIDEVSFWTTNLTQSNITDLYNGSNGCAYPFTGCSAGPPPPAPAEPPEITINTDLTEYTNSTDNPFFFNVSVTATNVTNITTWTVNVYHNDTLNTSIYTTLNLNASNLILNLTYGNEERGYDINITINNSNSGVPVYDNVEKLDIFLDSVIVPSVQQNIINNSILYYGINTIEIVNLSCSDNNLYACNLTLKNSTGGVLNNTFVENINTTSYNINFSFNVDALLNGSYEILGQVWDDHNPLDNNAIVKPLPWYFSGNNLIADNDITFQGDIKPNKTDGTPLTYFYLSENKYKLQITFEETKTIHHLNLSANNKLTYRPLSGYFGHFVYYGENGGRFIDMMGPNVKNVIVTDLGNNKYSLAVELYTASDEILLESIGSLNTLLSIWNFNISHGFTFTAIDSISNVSISNFTIEIWNSTDILDNKTTTTGNLTFNLTSGSYHTNITSPAYVRNESNITYSHAGTHTFFLTAENSLYLFFFDEETDILVDTINVSIDVLGPDSASNFLTDTGSKFISGFIPGNYEIRYSGPGYRRRTYYTQILTSTTQRIDLYMIKNTTSSLIVFFIGDEKSNPIFNATLKAKRFFLADNAYLVVSMERTDQNGETAMYLEPNDVFYEFLAEKAGVVIFTGSPQRIFSSNVFIRAPLAESEILGLSNIMLTTTTSLIYNNDTKILSYTFNDATSLVLQGCLKVIKTTTLTETTIGPTCVFSNSATLTINMTPHLQNDTVYTAIGTVTTNTTNTEFPTDTLVDFLRVNTPWDRFSKAGLFIAYIFILTMFFVGITFSFSTALTYSVLAMGVVQFIGLSFFGWSLIVMFIIVGFIVAVVNRI